MTKRTTAASKRTTFPRPRRARPILILSSALGLFFWLAGTIVFEREGTWRREQNMVEIEQNRKMPVDAIVCLEPTDGWLWQAGMAWYWYTSTLEKGQPRPLLVLAREESRRTLDKMIAQFGPEVQNAIRPGDVVIGSSRAEKLASELAGLAAREKWERLLLMSTPVHLKRYQYLMQKVFDAAGVRPQLLTYTAPIESFQASEWWQSVRGLSSTGNEFLRWFYTRWFWSPG